MKGDQNVLEYLQEVLTAELTALNQYFLHAAMMQNWGCWKLAALARNKSIQDMTHVELILARMLCLEASPTLAALLPIRIGQNVRQQIDNDLLVEYEAVPRLNLAIQAAVEAGDNGSRELFEKILMDEEEHVDYLEAQLHMIRETGYENYLAQHIHVDR